MAQGLINDTTLTAIGAAIREKTGETGLLLPNEMPAAILGISSGGGDIFANAKFYKYTNAKYGNYFVAPDDFTENSTILIWCGTIKQNASSTKYGVVWGGVLPRALYNEGIDLAPASAPLTVMGFTDQSSASYAEIGLPDRANLTENYSDSAYPDFMRRNGVDLQIVDGEKRLVYMEQRYSSSSTPDPYNFEGNNVYMIYIP